MFGDVTYYNDGDWVESCTALVEHADGQDGNSRLGQRTGAPTARSNAAGRRTGNRTRLRMKIALATDAWYPQVNGVVRALSTTVDRLRMRGHTVELITPDQFWTVPCPSYAEIRLALGCGRRVARRLDAIGADAIHIATEGPIGWAARNWCLQARRAFTTSFHTRFPDYAAVRTRLPADWFWPMMRRFHGPAARIMVATRLLADEIVSRGLAQTHSWPLGVDGVSVPPGRSAASGDGRAQAPDPALRRPRGDRKEPRGLSRNHEQGQQGRRRRRSRPGHLVGPLSRAPPSSVRCTARRWPRPTPRPTSSSFPASPTRSAWSTSKRSPAVCRSPLFPSAGRSTSSDAIGRGVHGGDRPIGALDEDLGHAIALALQADRQACIAEARHYDWEACTDAFERGLVPIAGEGSIELQAA